MQLDLTTFTFGVELSSGTGTPSWGTSLGQGKDYKLNPQGDNFYSGLVYSAIPDLSKVKCPLGRGGAVLSGGLPNERYSIDLAALFNKIYVNNMLIEDASFMLLVTRELESDNHSGRRTLKYSNKITYNDEAINEECINLIMKKLKLNTKSAWFVYNLDIKNQDELHFSVVVIDKSKNKIYENSAERKKDFENLIKINGLGFKNNNSRNLIVFGAPGTGKSFKLNNMKDELLSNGGDYERVTFHPDYTYANFVGTYKPVMDDTQTDYPDDIRDVLTILNDKSKTAQKKYDELFEEFNNNKGNTRLPVLVGIYDEGDFDAKTKSGDDTHVVFKNLGRAIRKYVRPIDGADKSDIAYEYVPGPFMRLFVKALKNPDKPYLLLIEEINRANVAAVFGDLFQLLDRDDNGESEYPVEASEDIKYYLHKNGLENNKIKIPNNMFIWATMNSADQGVFPMDTAFKRRWDFDYISIDDNESEIHNRVIELELKDGRKQYFTWNRLRKTINKHIAGKKINEDKQLGPFYISKKLFEKEYDDKNKEETLIKGEEFPIVFKNKVLMYLFEDVFKSRPMQIFRDNYDGVYSYSEICKNFDKIGIEIFDIENIPDILTHDKKDGIKTILE